LAQTTLGLPVGGTPADIYNDAGAGENCTPSLVTSLIPPDNSSDYNFRITWVREHYGIKKPLAI
jgi:hypothetical protein